MGMVSAAPNIPAPTMTTASLGGFGSVPMPPPAPVMTTQAAAHASAPAGGGGGLPPGAEAILNKLANPLPPPAPVTVPGWNVLGSSSASAGGTNTAQPNPQLMQTFNAAAAARNTTEPLLAENIANLRTRMSADTTKRATDKAISSSRDALAGSVQAAKERGAAGVMGGNTEPAIQALTEQAGRNEAMAASNIQLGREAAQDSLVLGGQQIYAAPSQRDLAYLGQQGQSAANIAGAQNAALGTNIAGYSAQAQAQAQANAAAMQASQAQQQQLLQLFSTLYS